MAIDQIFRVINEQSQATFDKDFNFISFYNWTGGNGALSPMVDNLGNGEPKAFTGLVGTHHRPSDDLSVFGKSLYFAELTQLKPLSAFLTPANAMLSVELTNLAQLLDQTHQLRNVSQQAKKWSSRIHQAIWDTTVRLYNVLY
jgi:meiotically up-regulated gene 157 (Mug157) protein